MQQYPKWIEVGGKGHPQNPGHVLVENEGQEAEALATGKGPRELNPPNDEDVTKDPVEVGNADGTVSLVPGPDSDKDPRDMDRSELIAAVVNRVQHTDASEADLRFVITVLNGDVPMGHHGEHDDDEANKGQMLKDAAGDKLSPDPAAEANKGDATKPTPDAPEAKSAPATDATPKEGAEKVADDKPAGNVTKAAATPPEHKKGAAQPAGKK